MRFQLSQALDAIEQRLTTDVTGAQAVADLGEIVRSVELDQGRPVNLVRIGMVVDALARYLVDGGAMLYGVADRDVLADSALTSKERMVLGRWMDDGRIEVVPARDERAAEVADLTGLPLITLDPRPDLLRRYGWLGDGTGRVLRLRARAGVAVLTPPTDAEDRPAADEPAVTARATVPVSGDTTGGGDGAGPAAGDVTGTTDADDRPGSADGGDVGERPEVSGDTGAVPADEPPAGDPGERDEAGRTDETPPAGDPEPAADPAGDGEVPRDPEPAGDAARRTDPATGDGDSGRDGSGETVPVPVAVFSNRGALPVARTRISWHRFLRDEPADRRAGLLGREWRCDSFDCPAFGELRRIGQPVPRLRDGVVVCPRHDEPMTDLGPRPVAYPMSLVIDDLPRRRLVVRQGQPVSVGRGGDDPPTLVSVAPWLHNAARRWISDVHLRLEAGAEGVTVTDLSDRGTVLWQRKGPDDPGVTRQLHRESVLLGEWDSVELYTGVEVARGDRRRSGTLGREEPGSVLVDAPTAAYHQV